jgi:hypothetical protein
MGHGVLSECVSLSLSETCGKKKVIISLLVFITVVQIKSFFEKVKTLNWRCTGTWQKAK